MAARHSKALRWALTAAVPLWSSLALAQTRENAQPAEVPLRKAERELTALQPLFVEQGVSLLHELRDLQHTRPEGPLEPWARELRVKYGYLARPGIDIVLLVTGADTGPMSTDEAEVRRGGVQKLLTRLAITGRLSRAEYDSFVRDLQGR